MPWNNYILHYSYFRAHREHWFALTKFDSNSLTTQEIMPSTTNRTVRFADNEDPCCTVWVYEAYATDNLWFTEEEQKEFRRSAIAQARQCRQQGVTSLLEGTFATDEKTTQASLNEVARSNPVARGLERFISGEHYNVRRENKVYAIKVILLAQTEAKERGYQLYELTEHLRCLSLQFSVSAKIFARRMGKADEACCLRRKSKKASVKKTTLSRKSLAPSASSWADSSLSPRQVHARLA